MKNFSFSTILGLAFGVLFVAYGVFAAFTPPGALPPGGNVDAPLNVGSTLQTKTGNLVVNSLGTLANLVSGGDLIVTAGDLDITGDASWTGTLLGGAVPWARIPDPKIGTVTSGLWCRGDGGGVVQCDQPAPGGSPGFGGQLDGFVRIFGTGAVTCNGNQCLEARAPGYCEQEDKRNGTPHFEARCAAGWTRVELHRRQHSSASTCNFEWTYACYKPNLGFCGNGIVEGEACDDGNTVNTAGNCLSDCSAVNLFPSPRILGACGGFDQVYPDAASATQFCIEQGFSSAAKSIDNNPNPCCGGLTTAPRPRYDGSSWVCTSTILNWDYIWCQP